MAKCTITTLTKFLEYFPTAESFGEKVREYGYTADIVVLWMGQEYRLVPSVGYWSNINTSNSKIFELLNIKNPAKFCEMAYGYPPDPGSFPESKSSDYIGLWRVAKAIFERIEQRKEQPKYTNKSDKIVIEIDLANAPEELSEYLRDIAENIDSIVESESNLKEAKGNIRKLADSIREKLC